MSLWKRICRIAEHKAVKKHMGDLQPLIDKCAIFEFSDEQSKAAGMHVPHDLHGDEYPIPPFPFPDVCIISNQTAMFMHEPEMDDDGELTFKVMAAFGDLNNLAYIARANCRVSTRKINDDGEIPMELSDKMGVFFSLGHPPNSFVDKIKIEPKQLDHLDMTDEEFEAWADRMMEEATPSESKGKLTIKKDGKDKALEFSSVNEMVVYIRRDERQSYKSGESTRAGIRGDGTASMKTIDNGFHSALQHINWVNHPDHYTVLLQGPVQNRKTKKGRIKRLDQRDRHIILTKQEITEAWHRFHAGGTHASPMPHLRRGHYKTLRSERYKDSQGKRIWVRATHVNGKCVEWRDGDVMYKVI